MQNPLMMNEQGELFVVFYDSYTHVVKFDAQLNKLWEVTFDILPTDQMDVNAICTTDGGILVGNDAYLHNPNRRGFYLVKIGPNGEIPLQAEDAPFKIKTLTVYPNPGSDFFNLSSSTDLSGSVLKVHDLTGREMYGEPLQGQQLKIDAQNWPKGVYIYHIAGKTNQSGKWVKQ
jgi:hypothetical protein